MIDMPKIPNSYSAEPALKVGTWTTLLTAIFFIVNSIFPNLLTTEVQTAIIAIATILIPIIMSIIIRNKVWSPNSVQEILNSSIEKAAQEAKEKERMRIDNLNTLKTRVSELPKKAEPSIITVLKADHAAGYHQTKKNSVCPRCVDSV